MSIVSKKGHRSKDGAFPEYYHRVKEEQEERAIGNLPPSLPPFGSSRVSVFNLTYSIGLCNDKIEQAILFQLA